MATILKPSPAGMTTLGPRRFIVCRRKGYANPFWATPDGSFWFSGKDLVSLTQELLERKALCVFALPRQDAPPNTVNLTKLEQAQLISLLDLSEVKPY